MIIHDELTIYGSSRDNLWITIDIHVYFMAIHGSAVDHPSGSREADMAEGGQTNRHDGLYFLLFSSSSVPSICAFVIDAFQIHLSRDEDCF